MSIPRRCMATVLAGALAVSAGSCSSWAGSHRISFDDPYINELPAAQTDGWLGMVRLFRAYARVDRAFQLEKEGRLDAAASDLKPYLEKNPEDVRVRAYYLGLLVRLDRTNQVIEQADSILAVQPTYVPALLARARARAGQGRLGPAVQDFLAASRSPTVRPADRADALADAARYTLGRGRELEGAARWGDAAAVFASALELPLTPDQRVYARVERHRSAAAQAEADGNLREAAAQLEAALAVEAIPSTDQRDVLTRLAAVLEAMGRPAEAGARVEQILAMGPAVAGAAESTAAGGAQSVGAAATQGAGAATGTGVSTAPTTVPSLHRRAAALFIAAGQPARAATHLEAAGRLVGGTAGVGLLRRAAALYHQARWYPEEITALREATAIAPSDRSVRAELGRVLLESGQLAEAETSLEKALEGTPSGLTSKELTDARMALATAHEAAGRVDDAMEIYREVVAAPTDSTARVRALKRLAEIHGQRGEHRQAGAWMMELFRATGEGSWARRAGDSYAVAGAWSDAAVSYGAAREAGALPGPEGARRLGVALYEAGRHDAAASVLATIPPDERTPRDLGYLAAAARERGDTDRAVTFYRSALDGAATPADSAAILASVGYLLLQRDDSAAVAAMGASLRLRSDPALRLDMARAQMRLGQPDDALTTLQSGAPTAPTAQPSAATADTVPATRTLERLDLLTEVQLARGDTAAALEAVRTAAEMEPTARRLNRLAYLYERTGDEPAAAETFRRAYEAEPSALQAARVGYAYRRIGAEVKAATWFRRSIDTARSTPTERADVDLDAIRQEEALLTDRVVVAAYASVRQNGGATGLPPAGVGQATVASQGGVEVRVLPLVQRVPWGREVDVLARLFWAFDDGVQIDPDSYQGQLGIRYRPRRVPGVALGLERWIGIGSAARDVWATRLQYSHILGRPYPEADAGPAPFAAFYGDAAYLFDHAGTYTFYAEARPGLAVPLGHHTDLIPHVVASAYRQSPGGIRQSRIEAGPGLGLRLRLPREDTYTRDFWSLELMAQYRWGLFPKSWNAGGGSYRGMVFTLAVQF